MSQNGDEIKGACREMKVTRSDDDNEKGSGKKEASECVLVSSIENGLGRELSLIEDDRITRRQATVCGLVLGPAATGKVTKPLAVLMASAADSAILMCVVACGMFGRVTSVLRM